MVVRVHVDPAQFIGTASNEDSLFVGLVRDGGTYVGAWYNNFHQSSGIDIRVNGQSKPAGDGAYQPHQVIAPGDRFALQVHGTTITSWAGHNGNWQRIASSDVGSVVNDLSGFHAMFGVRGDPGQIAVSRFEVRSSP